MIYSDSVATMLPSLHIMGSYDYGKANIQRQLANIREVLDHTESDIGVV